MSKLVSQTYEKTLKLLQEKIQDSTDDMQRAYLSRLYNIFQEKGLDIIAEVFTEVQEESPSNDKLP